MTDPSPADLPSGSIESLTAQLGQLREQQALLERRLEDLRHDRDLSERRLASVLDGTKAGSWEWNVKTGETVFNERWAEIVGWTLAELAPVSIKTWLDLAHPDDLSESERRLNRVFAREDDHYDLECRMLHRDGSIVWVHDRGKVIEWAEDGSPLYMAGSHTDITHRKRIETQLREDEELYHAIFEKSRAVKLLVDPASGALVDVNSAACAFYGYTRERMRSMRVSELNTLAPELIQREMRRALHEHMGYFEFRHRLATGEIRDVEVYSSAVRIGGRDLLNSIVHDVTDRRRAQDARVALQRQLQQAEKAESLARMAGAVAHRFNNQLQAMLGNLELTRLALAEGESAASLLDAAKRATLEAAQLGDLMLTYLGQKPGHPEPIDVAAFCRDHLEHFRAALRADAMLEFEDSTDACVVTADPQQLAEVIGHLLANAAESRERGPARVRLRVSCEPASALEGRHRVPLDWCPTESRLACIAVGDDGAGIAPEALEKIFDPFYSTKFTGRGMGLSVLLGLVRMHGGAVTVDSTPGSGSTFRVYLPAQG